VTNLARAAWWRAILPLRLLMVIGLLIVRPGEAP
jgi:hypothetical protein